MKFLDKVGLSYWTSKIKSYVNTKIEDLKTLLSKDIEKKQDKLTAGTNVTITGTTISATDTKYTHPSSHSANMITENTNKRFVSDTEKNTWNNKLDKDGDGSNLMIKLGDDEMSLLTIFYILSEEIGPFISFIEDNSLDIDSGKKLSTNDYTNAEKQKLNGIEANAQKNTITSVNGKTGAVTITKSDLGLGSVENIGIKILTQSQYDALSDTEKNRSDILYGIYEV